MFWNRNICVFMIALAICCNAIQISQNDLSSDMSSDYEDDFTNNSTTSIPTSMPPIVTTETPDDDLPPLVKFVVHNTTKEGRFVCIVVEMRANLTIPYFTNDSTIHETTIVLVKNTSYHGDCYSDKIQTLTVIVSDKLNVTTVWSKQMPAKATVNLERNQSSGAVSNENLGAALPLYALTNITISGIMDNDTFPGTNYTGRYVVKNYSKDRFLTRAGDYYACDSDSELSIGNITVRITDLKMRAFAKDNSDKFSGIAVRCLNDTPADPVVPIAVAIGLAILTVVVILSYFLASRRFDSTDPAYQNMVNT